MKKAVILIMAVVLCILCFTACSRYSSKYAAVGFVHSNTSKEASMSFFEFEGTMVFELESSGDLLRYSAKLEKGSASVCYDIDGIRKDLFKLNAGEKTSASVSGFENKKVTIIIETNGKCENGDFKFEAE